MLMAFLRHQSQYKLYIPNRYIRIIIFPYIDDTQSMKSMVYHTVQKWGHILEAVILHVII